MAVAGLQNVSAFGPSFYGESRSPVSRMLDNDRGSRPCTRASSLLRMWRELEGDHVVSHSHGSRQQRNDSGSECLSSVGQGSDNGNDVSEDADEIENQGTRNSEVEHDDNNSVLSEQSSDLGEIERERVRQIFREWMDSGGKDPSSSGVRLNNRSGPQWLGENECERVRIIREWVQMNTQQKNNCGSPRDGDAEGGSQFEQVRDGLAIAHAQICGRRPIRRLYGRQTLLDLLLRAQNERQKELQGLSERRPVSDFAHRNRIQALLRGRFLKNERLISDMRPSSVAATELGLLRERHTVSGLREEFLSKFDNSASASVNGTESGSSCSCENNKGPESTSSEWVLGDMHATDLDIEGRKYEVSFDNGHACPSQEPMLASKTRAEGIISNDERVHAEHTNSGTEIEDQHPVLDIGGRKQEVSLDNGHACSSEDLWLGLQTSAQDLLSNLESAERTGTEHTDATTVDDPDTDATTVDDSLLEMEDRDNSAAGEVSNGHYELRSDVSYVCEVVNDSIDLEGNTNEELDLHDASGQAEEIEESVMNVEDGDWQQLAIATFNEWADGDIEVTERSVEENSTNQWFPETSDNNLVEQDEMQESHDDWPGHDFQEAIDGWLEMPLQEVVSSVGRMDAVYFPDDDNIHSLELRELFSRRRVSSLLRSSFRESLNQVLQSHVERLGHASADWETDDASALHELVEQGQEPLHGDQTLDVPDNADRNLFAPTEIQSLWDGDFHAANWPHNNSNQHYGTEWEVINELRVHIAKLQQRMNNMQSMLEACMEMQIELQRSVRQEVSAALNRSLFSKDTHKCKDTKLHDESQWDYVRKGICCLCGYSKIDSLLYRCGHMCACLKCAENLVMDMGKCPMCQAPVVEVVRAYFTQS